MAAPADKPRRAPRSRALRHIWMMTHDVPDVGLWEDLALSECWRCWRRTEWVAHGGQRGSKRQCGKGKECEDTYTGPVRRSALRMCVRSASSCHVVQPSSATHQPVCRSYAHSQDILPGPLAVEATNSVAVAIDPKLAKF